MKKAEVQIGGKYAVRISGRDILDVVTIIEESPFGGWKAVVRRSGREIRIKSAAKLRYRVPEPQPVPMS